MATSLILSSPVISQKKKTPPAAKSPTAGMHKYTGFFNFFYEPATDKIFLEIASFEEEFLYVNSLAAGIGSNDIGLDRGQLGGDKVVRFVKVGPKVLMIQPNYGYRVTSTNPFEMEAVEQAFAQSVLWGFKVQHEYDGKVLVDATEFLQRDAHKVAEKLESANQGTYKLDKSRTAFYLKRTKSFPENSEFEATLTFTGKAEGSYIKSVAPSPDAVTVRQHHSFIKLPDNNYTPRVFDPRAGYFGISYADYGTPIDQPLVKRFIARHRLRKKDPAAEKSEAVEPIVYHLDRGTPEPIRSALLEGASWWNQAFEAAGYINAFQVKMLPEDADPMDVRYNLIQWVHRSTRGWSYGSSVGDPRTGEIIKGHVSLGSLRVRQDFLIAIGLMSPYKSDGMPENMKEMALARLRQLSAHEVGHTLGLAHNYSASMDGRTSVMDYPHPKVNIVDGKLDLSDAYDSGIGSWDKVSIAYGYQDFPAGTSEEAGLKSILSKAYQQDGLSFISDQDARPAGSAHPRAHLWDNGRNAATELDHVLAVRRIALNQFSENNVAPGQPLATLEESLVPIYFFHRYQMEAAVKIVGGLDYTYAMRGDSQEPTAMIDPALQQQALTAVLKTISPTTLTLSEDLLKIIPPRPLGYRRSRETIRTRTGLTFDPIAPAETAADMTLRFLLHPERATRLIEHHARDSSQPDLSDVLSQLMDVSWKSAPVSGLQGEVRRAVNSVVLLNMMRLAGNDRASMQVRAITSQHLVNLQDWLEQKADGTKLGAEKAHLLFAVAQIKQFRKNPESIKGAEPLNPPDGSPIGMDKVYCSFHE
jgi:hypothetical protein